MATEADLEAGDLLPFLRHVEGRVVTMGSERVTIEAAAFDAAETAIIVSGRTSSGESRSATLAPEDFIALVALGSSTDIGAEAEDPLGEIPRFDGVSPALKRWCRAAIALGSGWGCIEEALTWRREYAEHLQPEIAMSCREALNRAVLGVVSSLEGGNRSQGASHVESIISLVAESTLARHATLVDTGKSSAEPRPGASHSLDYRSVKWFGESYSFTPTQAACVKVLWEAWDQGTPDLGEVTVLDHPEVDSNAKHLRDLFRNHVAWGLMIREGRTKGAYRLSPPET